MRCTLKILDEVNIKFDNLDMKTRREMVKELKFFIPAARHTPAFKLGRWDGTVSYCGVGGQSQLNMLDKLLPIVFKNGYEVDIDDQRNEVSFEFEDIHVDHFSKLGYVWPDNHPVANQPVVLRDYQVEIIDKFLKGKQCIQQVATGAGKTLICASLSAIIEKHGRTLVIVPNKSLVVQTEEDYINLGLDVGVYFGDRKNLDKTHTICTWQSLERLMALSKKEDPDDRSMDVLVDNAVCVIVDECHGAKAQILRQLLTGPFANIPLRFGLTGTVPKEDFNLMALVGSIGPVVHSLSAKELQDKGILSQCHVRVLQTLQIEEFNSFPSEYSFLTSNTQRMKWLAETVGKISTTGNTLVLVNRIASGTLIQERLDELGIESSFINGTVKLDERKDEYDDVATATNKVIIATYGVAAVGINIPRIFNLVLLEPGKSFVKVIQSIGRGIRMAPDKDFVQVWDIAATTKYSKRHLTARKKFYKEAEYPCSVSKIKMDETDIGQFFK